MNENLNEAGLSKTNLARLCENSYNFNIIVINKQLVLIRILI